MVCDPPLDLRSDTVTRPTAAMRDAMMSAPLGDDVLGDEPTVQRLEQLVARRLGKDAALFTPSGTMANQLAIRCHCEAGDEVIAHGESHIIHYETGAPAAIAGCMVRPVSGPRGLFDADAVHAAVRHADIHSPRSRLVVAENTHNRGGGSVWPLHQFERVADAARHHGLAVHVDGARLWNACVAAGYSAAAFVAASDTVSVCFSKGLGAPVGSALAGPRALIDRARRFRKMLGGGMRQSGLLAAAAIYALDHHVERLRDDHAAARALAVALAGMEGIAVDPAPNAVETNMVFFTIAPRMGDARTFCDRLAAEGVHLIAMGPSRVRAVLHLDAGPDAPARAAAAVERVARAQ
jgi:threonine aldolase